MKFYTSIFPKSEIGKVSYYRTDGPGKKGSISTIEFKLNGMDLMALNGGPEYQFTPAISLFVNCENQAEVDYFWEKLSEGGEKGPCGWLTDNYGLSWQIIPTILGVLLSNMDEKKAERAMNAMLKMSKLDIEALKRTDKKIVPSPTIIYLV